MKFTAIAPGTCGELLQGFIDDKDFLINSPIPFFAKASVTINNKESKIEFLEEEKYSKINRIIDKILSHFKIKENIALNFEIDSKIPRGKGLASSTAELTAVILAISKAFNKNLSDNEISNLLISVDKSSDGVFLPGISYINHLKGHVYKKFQHIPSLSFIIVDSGGEISTQKFDRILARNVSLKHENSLRAALKIIKEGFLTKNSKLIAQAATISARINQNVLYKDPFETLVNGTKEYGGLGVNCAHTGTVLGVMFDHKNTDQHSLLERVKTLIHPLPIIGIYPLISGSRIN
ncbi:GHMP family kinase ATP-binding protein [Pigmentibacter ruber]